jgi:hypothetical protein
LIVLLKSTGASAPSSERKMNIGKSYWAVSIKNKAAETSMPRKEYSEMRRALRAEASIVLNNKFEYRTEKEALAAKKKLPKELQSWVQINESFPVSLGFRTQALDRRDQMKFVNEKGVSALKRWIESTRGEDEFGPLAETDPRALNAWACEAEESMLAGNPPVVEMSQHMSRSGRPETFTLTDDMIDEREEDE